MEQPQNARLSGRFDSRHNSVNALRLILALLVLASHTLTLAGGVDPLGEFTGGNVDIGTVAVDGFFVLSGFLIASSFVNSPSVWRYLWRRCLRILPAFWVCLIVSAVVILPLAQVLEYGSIDGFPLTGQESVLGYVINNAGLWMRQFEVRGLMQGWAVDGSLYTLFYEFACYLGIALVGVLGLLTRHRWVVLGVAGALWLTIVADAITGGAVTSGSVTTELFQRLGVMFMAGVITYLWAERIPLNWIGGVGATILLIGALVGASYQGADPTSRLTYLVLAPAAVAYLVMLIGASTRLSHIGARRDVSYGVYIYAWPVQVLLLLVGAADWPVVLYFAASVAVTWVLAWASWTLVESRALKLKSWTPRRRVSPASTAPAPDQRMKRVGPEDRRQDHQRTDQRPSV